MAGYETFGSNFDRITTAIGAGASELVTVNSTCARFEARSCPYIHLRPLPCGGCSLTEQDHRLAGRVLEATGFREEVTTISGDQTSRITTFKRGLRTITLHNEASKIKLILGY